MEKMELTLREELFPHWVLYALFFTILVLSILKSQKEMVLENISNTFFKPPSTSPVAKENLGFKSSTNFIMLLNYFAVGGIMVYMLLIYFEKTDYWMVALPGIIYFFQILSLLLVASLSGEYKKVRENIYLLNFYSHISGILLIPILFVWILNPQLSESMIIVLFSIILMVFLFRIVRGIFMAIRNNVLWYYIIVYLCGLEIWPLVVVYLFLSPNFVG